VLSACSQQATAPEPETSDAPAASATAANIAADGKASAGKYKITTHDGKIVMEEDKADGTFVTTLDGKVVETGKWEQKSPTTFCFTKDGKDAKQECNEEKVENGVWTSKNAKGEVSTVERIAG
jgi:flagellar hook assembly protein FlgD